MLSQVEICDRIDIRKEVDKTGDVITVFKSEKIGRGRNRYIVECKVSFWIIKHGLIPGRNRYIVECKGVSRTRKSAACL